MAMNLRDSSIRSRLLAFGTISGVLIVGIYVAVRWADARVGRSYQSIDAAQQTIQSAYGSIEKAGEFKDEINLLAQDVMELRLREKTFLQFQRAELKDRFEQLAAQMSRDRAAIIQRSQIGNDLEDYRKAFTERAALQLEHDALKQAMTEPLRASETRLTTIQGDLEAKQAQLQMEGGTLKPDEAEMLNVARDCMIVFLKLQNLQQQFLATGDAKFIEQYKKVAAEDAQAGIRSLREFATALGSTNFVESAKLISASLDAFLKDIDKSVALTARQKQLEQQMDSRGAAILQAANQQVIAANRQVLDHKQSVTAANDQMRQAHTSVAATKKTAGVTVLLFILGTMAVGTIACIFIIVSINRSLNGTITSLNDGARQTTESAFQMQSASGSLAEGASEQAASLEETSASLEEVASMIKRNADNAHRADVLAKEARQAADAGDGEMRTMTTAMNDIKASSDEIAKIIKAIDEIAFQTNILALNAAVEAARAGEAGMGFAVVADEVRSLAQRSATAARETAAKIETAVSRSSQGVQISGRVAQCLHTIIDKVRQVGELVGAVATASAEQSQAIQQVNSAVTQMDKVTQRNAASAEESASAAEELNAQAETLRSAVRELEQLVGGAAASPAVSQKASDSSRRPAPVGADNRTVIKSFPPVRRGGLQAASRTPATAIPLEGDSQAF